MTLEEFNFYNYWKNRYPNADKDVLKFITDFNYHTTINNDEREVLRKQFRCGYCYYFAVILKEAFNRGTICWCAPFGHICWMDDDGIPYDIEGVNESDCDYYILVSYIKEGLADFMHVPNKVFNASEEYIQDAIERYKKDNNL